jgi:hypothetical protein
MSGITIRQRVEDYLAMRHALGFALVQDGRLLLDFADRLDQDGQDTVTVPAALAWAAASQASANQQARRLGIVRVFARHLHALDPACQIPAPACSQHVRIGRRRSSIPRPTSPPWSTPPAPSPHRCRRRQ